MARVRKQRETGGVLPRLIDVPTAAAYLSLGINSTRKLADEHGLIVRFGRRVLIDRVKLDEVLAEMGN